MRLSTTARELRARRVRCPLSASQRTRASSVPRWARSEREGALDAAEVAAKAIKCKWTHFSKDDGAVFGRAQLGKMMKAEVEELRQLFGTSSA